jgi:hypothetical protein
MDFLVAGWSRTPSATGSSVSGRSKGHDAQLSVPGFKSTFDFTICGIHTPRGLYRLASDVLTLAALWGHTTVQTTSRHVHPTDLHKQEAVQELEAHNADVIFKYTESVSGSLQKPLQ